MHRLLFPFSILFFSVSFSLFSPARADEVLSDSGTAATESLPSALLDVGIDEHLDAGVPLDAAFTDESGNAVRLANYFRSPKPVLLNFAYFRCPMLCNLVLAGMVEGMKQSNLSIGKDFEVITVSMDPSEGPVQAAAKKKTHIDALGRPEAAMGWHFLTGKEPQILRLADAIGFRYHYNQATDDFSHTAAIFTLSPQGKICRYLYGVNYAPQDLKLALLEASEGKSLSVGDKLLLYCYHYDANAKGYVLFAQHFMRAGGYVVLAVMLLLLGGLWVKEVLKKRA